MALGLRAGGAAWRWTLMVGAVLSPGVALSQSQPGPSILKEAEPDGGTRISKTIASSQRIPLNKRWSELSAEERAEIRSNYEDMPQADEPPFPLEGMAPIFRQLSIDAGRAGIHGTFVIDVTVNAHGDGTKVTLVQYPSVDAAKVVAYVLVKTKYKPAVCHGVPCIMDFPFSIKLVAAP